MPRQVLRKLPYVRIAVDTQRQPETHDRDRRLSLASWQELSEDEASDNDTFGSLDSLQRLGQPAFALTDPVLSMVSDLAEAPFQVAAEPQGLGRFSEALSPAATVFASSLPRAVSEALVAYRSARALGDPAQQLQANRQALQSVHQAVDAHLSDNFDMQTQILMLKRTAFLDETSAVLLECARLLEADSVPLVSQLRAEHHWAALFSHLPASSRDEARDVLLRLEHYVDAPSPSQNGQHCSVDCAQALKAHFVEMMVDTVTVTELKDLLSYQQALAPQPLMRFNWGKGLGCDGLSVQPLTESGEVDLYGSGLCSINEETIERSDGHGRPLGVSFQVSVPRSYAEFERQEVGLYRTCHGGLTTAGLHAVSLYHEIVGHGIDIVRGQLPTHPRDDGWTGEWEVTAIARENTKRKVLGLSARGAHEAFRAALPLDASGWHQRGSPNFFQATARSLVGRSVESESPSVEDGLSLSRPTSDLRRTVTNTFSF
jgi:hypothetical protein